MGAFQQCCQSSQSFLLYYLSIIVFDILKYLLSFQQCQQHLYLQSVFYKKQANVKQTLKKKNNTFFSCFTRSNFSVFQFLVWFQQLSHLSELTSLSSTLILWPFIASHIILSISALGFLQGLLDSWPLGMDVVIAIYSCESSQKGLNLSCSHSSGEISLCDNYYFGKYISLVIRFKKYSYFLIPKLWKGFHVAIYEDNSNLNVPFHRSPMVLPMSSNI